MSEEKALREVSNRGLATVAIMAGTVMQALDTTIANVALPNMSGDLSASPDEITWVLTSYIVAAAIVTPMTGWLSDRFGRKELFLASVVGFVVASMLCGLAWSLEAMVFFRLLQGVFGAAIMPLSQLFLLDINPKSRQGQAMAVWGAGVMIGPIVGPTLGGWLTDSYNWRWVFYINVPVGILAFLGVLAFLPKVQRSRRDFDFFGFAMLSIGVGALQLMLDRGANQDWFSSTEIWIETGLSLIGFWAFIIHTATAERSFINAKIFRDRNFAVGLPFAFVVGLLLLAATSLLPPMLTGIFDYPTATTGLVMGPRGVGSMIAMIAVGRVMRVVDTRALVTIGMTLVALSCWMMSGFTPDMDNWPVISAGFVQGLGIGLVFVPLSTIAFSTLDPSALPDATALFTLVRNVGSSIGISLFTALVTRNTQVNHAELSTFINPFNPALLAANPSAAQGDPTALMVLDGLVNAQAQMISYVDDYKLMMLMALMALPLVLLLRAPKRSSGGESGSSIAME